MKILHLLDEPWDSGLTSYALELVQALQKKGEEVWLAVLAGKKPEALALEKGLKVLPYSSLVGLYKIICQEPWDVINAHTGRTHTWAFLMGGFSSWVKSDGLNSKKIPVIRTRGEARAPKINLLQKFLYKKTAAVVTASEHIRNQYQRQLNWDLDRLETIYPTVSLPKIDFPPPSNRVGILGRLDPIKGHSVFLKAAIRVLRERPQTKFLVAGKEAGLSIRDLQQLAKELGIEGSVEILGFQPSSLEFMKDCTLGVIASLGSEEISRAALEWMALGRPVVGTRVGCLPELIESHVTGLLIDPGNEEQMAEAILKILSEVRLTQSWGRNARLVAETKFGPDQLAEKTMKVYRRAVERGKWEHV